MTKKKKQKRMKISEQTLITISILVSGLALILLGLVEGSAEHTWDINYPNVWAMSGMSSAALLLLYREFRGEDTSKIPITLWSFIPLLGGLVALGMEVL